MFTKAEEKAKAKAEAKAIKAEEKAKAKAEAKSQRWVFRFLHDSGFVIKKTTKEILRDTQGTAIDTVVVPPIKVNIVGGLLIVNETMGKRFNTEPAVIARLIKSKPGFGKRFFCLEEPDKVLTKVETAEIEAMIEAKDKIPTGPEVITGARGRG